MNPTGIKLTIASPCGVKWDEMSGDERSRMCGQCDKRVYNVAALTRDEIFALIKEKEGKVCVRMFRRADGTVLTADCPVGLARARRMIAFAAFAALAVMLAPVLLYSLLSGGSVWSKIPGVRALWGTELTGALPGALPAPAPVRKHALDDYGNQQTY